MRFFIDNLPVRVASRSLQTVESLLCTYMHFTQIIFPYDRIYPGGFAIQFDGLELTTLRTICVYV
jgi:hypothetical protein